MTERAPKVRSPTPAEKLAAIDFWCLIFCHACAKFHPLGNMEFDHIVTRALGGTNAPDNLRPLCLPCHDLKTNGPKHLKKDGDKSKIAAADRIANGGKVVKHPMPKTHQKLQAHVDAWGKEWRAKQCR